MSQLANGTEDSSNVSLVSGCTYCSEEATRRWLWISISPVLLVLGLCGNTLNLVTLLSKGLRKRTSTVYLVALAIADIGALLLGLLTTWIRYQFGVDTMDLFTVTCKFRKFTHYIFSDMSVWLICAFTLDRTIAVLLPHRMKSICTRRRTQLTTVFIFLAAVVKNLSVVITRTLQIDPLTNQSACTRSPFDEFVRPWIVFATVNVVPFTFICICNVCIVRHVRHMSSSSSSSSPSSSSSSTVQCPMKSRLQSQLGAMTRMCLSISFAFLILISPSMILLVSRPYWTSTEASTAKFNIASTVGSLCQYTSNSINVYLYCASGKAFREQLVQQVRLISGCRPKENSQTQHARANVIKTLSSKIASAELRKTCGCLANEDISCTRL